MKNKIMVVFLTCLLCSGCATTMKQPAPVVSSSLYTKIADLENRLNQKDREIEDLQYEIKDLYAQIENMDLSSVEEAFPPPQKTTTTKNTPPKHVLASQRTKKILLVPVSVTEVQQALKNAGYYEANIDGKIGPKTKQAIKTFQKEHGLKDDGLVGQQTWNEMKNYLD